MSQYREHRCVVKARGRAAVVASLREGYEYESLGVVGMAGTAVAVRLYDGLGRLLIAHDSTSGDEWDGPLVITGVGAQGQLRSLEPIEAQQIVAHFPARPMRKRDADGRRAARDRADGSRADGGRADSGRADGMDAGDDPNDADDADLDGGSDR